MTSPLGGGKRKLIMHDRVALTRCSLENLTILYVQLTASILNPVRRLQHTRGNCNARTPSA